MKPNETERNQSGAKKKGERATLASASGARRSGARPVASRVTRVRTSRKNCLAFALASGSDAENTGAPAGALRPWLVASRATVARSAMFLPARHGRLPRDRQSRARPWSGGLRDCDVRCRADDTNPSPNPRARTVRRGEGRCPRRVRDREGKNENRPGIGIQSERADSLNPLRSTRASATAYELPVCRVPFGLGDKKRWRPDLVALHHRHFETRTTEAERAFPRRASSASRA